MTGGRTPGSSSLQSDEFSAVIVAIIARRNRDAGLGNFTPAITIVTDTATAVIVVGRTVGGNISTSIGQ